MNDFEHEYNVYFNFSGYQVSTLIETDIRLNDDSSKDKVVYDLAKKKLISLGVDMTEASNGEIVWVL